MCIMSSRVRAVTSTRIFARLFGDGRQALVYQMHLDADEDVAMVLPVPIVPGTGDDALAFVDLSGCPKLFDELAAVFVGSFMRYAMQPQSIPRGMPKLVVHDVGEFIASYVPALADFDRLDRRFRLPASAFPMYPDWGFAVFQLKSNGGFLRRAKPRTIHPMGMSFPTRSPQRLFFPTLHIHDGATIEPTARFDHELYAQGGGAEGWEHASGTLAGDLSARSKGLVDASHLRRRTLTGRLDNADTWLDPVV